LRADLWQCEFQIFCTNLQGKPHKVIALYDKRADVENLIGEAKFKNNYAFFQIVMMAYNIWRYFKMTAQLSAEQSRWDSPHSTYEALEGLVDNTIRIARLKLLLIAAKLTFHDNHEKAKFSIHDARTPAMIKFLKFLDTAL